MSKRHENCLIKETERNGSLAKQNSLFQFGNKKDIEFFKKRIDGK